jgi:hypothetical protein
MTVIDAIIPAWFALAVLIEIAGTIGLRLWLTRRGAKPNYVLSGVPGYLEHFYWKWSNRHRHPSKPVLVLRTFSLINVILASVFFVIHVSGRK